MFVIQKRCKNTTLHYIPMYKGPPTAIDFSTSLRHRRIVTSHVLFYCVKSTGVTWVCRHRAAARCRSVKKLLPCRAEKSSRSGWSD